MHATRSSAWRGHASGSGEPAAPRLKDLFGSDSRVDPPYAPGPSVRVDAVEESGHDLARLSTYAGGRGGKECAASLRAEQRLAPGGRRPPDPEHSITRGGTRWIN